MPIWIGQSFNVSCNRRILFPRKSCWEDQNIQWKVWVLTTNRVLQMYRWVVERHLGFSCNHTLLIHCSSQHSDHSLVRSECLHEFWGLNATWKDLPYFFFQLKCKLSLSHFAQKEVWTSLLRLQEENEGEEVKCGEYEHSMTVCLVIQITQNRVSWLPIVLLPSP